MLTLTTHGLETAQQIDTILQELEAELGRGLDGKERKRLRRALEHIAGNMVHVIGADERRIDPPEDLLVAADALAEA